MELLDVEIHKVMLFTVHDGAANMVKTSQFLKSTNFQHCIAHSLHLLLMNDGINRIDELTDLIERRKVAIRQLTFKSCQLMDEAAKIKDRENWKELCDMLSQVNEVLDADATVMQGLPDTSSVAVNSSSSSLKIGIDSESQVRQHQTLKQPNVTRWNSILYMIKSILKLWQEMNEALKRNGD